MQDRWPGWSSDEFLVAFRDWYFPGARIGVAECQGLRVRTVLHRPGRAVSGYWPFAFYLEPLPDYRGPARPVPYLADVVARVTAASEPGPRGALACPFVDWSGVPSFDSFLENRAPLHGQDSPATIAAKARRIEREFGPLTLRRGVSDPDVFNQILDWKSAQYARTASTNRLASAHNRGFYHELRTRGVAFATALHAGERLIAGKIGLLLEGRQFSRLTVYDPSLRKFSPGSVLELESLRASFASGDREFDFLMGDQPYKFTWATHVRWLQDAGREPALDRLVRSGRSLAGRAVHGKPGAGALTEAARHLGTLPRRLRF